MTVRPLINRVPSLSYRSCQISRAVRGPHMMALAETANVCALGRPSRGFNLYGVGYGGAGVFAASYSRTHAAINQAIIEWTVRLLPAPTAAITATTETWSVTLVIRDALGNVVNDTRIPTMFNGTSRTFTINATGPSADPVVGGIGYLDLDAIATTLTDPSWSFEFTVFRSAGSTLVIDRIWMRELARTIVDTSETYGVDVADFQPGQPAGAGSTTTTGTLRLARTIDGAIVAMPDVLVLGWEDVTSVADTPSTTSAAYAALTLLEQAAGVPMRFRVPIRPIYVAAPPGDVTGETGRFRVRYAVTGGGTAKVQLNTGSTGSPYQITGLASATFVWSDWVACRFPTNATGAIATLTLEGLTTAGTLFVSAVHVQQT
jgi:hypothetical protein